MEEQRSHTLGEAESDLQEVWFFIEKDEDGYPESRTWEGLWSRSTKEGFEVRSIPFYLKNVSRGDTVAAVQHDFLHFTEVLKRGGHNTYRLLMQSSSGEVNAALEELRSKGLATELNETGILIAVDVPPSVNQNQIDAYLLAEVDSGRWQIQDGYLSSIMTS